MLITKGLNGDDIVRYIKILNMKYQEVRSELAPEVHQSAHEMNCSRFNSTSSKVTGRVKFNHAQNISDHRTVLESTEAPHVFETAGDSSHDCGCQGCWMFCRANERA